MFLRSLTPSVLKEQMCLSSEQKVLLVIVLSALFVVLTMFTLWAASAWCIGYAFFEFFFMLIFGMVVENVIRFS